ncbi:MAG: sensor histidine kinase [Bacteroidia bacterium]
MDLKEAEKLKAFNAEKQVSYVRMIVIVFCTITFFGIHNSYVQTKLVYSLMAVIWPYGIFVLFFRPYKKYPIFLTSWLTSIFDCILIIAWTYATGGYYSPFHVVFYTSIIAVSFRFNFKTTFFTSTLYTACYFGLLFFMHQLEGNEIIVIVRTGFIYIIGFMTNLITKETLLQTQQKLSMKKLVEQAEENHKQLRKHQEELNMLNEQLQLRNNIFNHAEENANIGSYAWNLATNQLKYSDNLFRILGCRPQEFTPTMEKYLQFLHPEDKQQVLNDWENSLKNKLITQSYHRVITKDNKLKYIRSTGKITGEEPNILIIGTLQDISGDVELNEAVKQKNLELERSNNELAAFNYIASHDLQEPLRKIQTFTKLVIEKESASFSETVTGYLSRISSAANRMQHLIDAFLNYSRINNSKLVFENTDLNVVIDEVINNLTENIQENNVLIEKNTLPVLPLVPFQAQQLFINLITNAIKYAKKDTRPVIKIIAQKVLGKDLNFEGVNKTIHYWRIEVSDNGIGFEQKYADKIFEVFQRLHNKEEYAGTGIGLAICKKIAMSHHGCIEAKGIPGQGATFTVYFPATTL